MTWHGHASALVELDGTRILTDPAFTPRLAHLRRHHRVDLDAVGVPDVVLISHVHMDHLHLPSLRLLGPDVEIIVPAGAAALLRRRGFRNVRETRAGETADIGSVTVETVPAVHGARRGPYSRVSADAVGYVVRSPTGSVYFPGDTALFDAMAELEGVDVALLPIWGWGSNLGDGHLDPTGAVRATELIQPRLVVPVHWGTYSPQSLRRGAPEWLHRPADRFAAELAAAGAGERLRLVTPGGSVLVADPAAPVTEDAAPPSPSSAGES